MPRDAGAGQDQAIEIIDSALAALGLEVLRPSEDLFSVRLPGTRKLVTECVLQVGVHGVSIRAFVARNPDENHEAVYRWLLQRNLKLYGVAFTLDSLGDIYLTGRIALESVSAAEVDRLLGAVADTADSSFNPILELGFAESIQREWAWRRSRGEPIWNLAAFRQFDPGPPDPGPPDPGPPDPGPPDPGPPDPGPPDPGPPDPGSGGSEPPDPKARR